MLILIISYVNIGIIDPNIINIAPAVINNKKRASSKTGFLNKWLGKIAREMCLPIIT